MSDDLSEGVRVELRNELALRIRLAFAAAHPDILSPHFLRHLSEVAADESLAYFGVLDEIERNPEHFHQGGVLSALRDLLPWE